MLWFSGSTMLYAMQTMVSLPEDQCIAKFIASTFQNNVLFSDSTNAFCTATTVSLLSLKALPENESLHPMRCDLSQY